MSYPIFLIVLRCHNVFLIKMVACSIKNYVFATFLLFLR
nr:MAG TPA: hypothetical protein [Bacteriophage sp.]